MTQSRTYRCPVCGGTDFSVLATGVCRMDEHGELLPVGSFDTDDGSWCVCDNDSCEHSATVAEFAVGKFNPG